jgi:hypothetical protein
LIPGSYTVKAEKAGFQTEEAAALQLTVASSLSVNFTLKIGEVTQTVEVQAVAPLLDTNSATVGTTVSNASVLEMPLNGRAYTDLLALIPGSVANGTTYQAAGGANYSISGNRFEQNDYTLDGVSNNEGFFKSYGIQPAIDAIQEFKVQTNITSSEFGEAAGANVAVATKSGTNNIHGSAYEFLRNSSLDAPEWITNKTGGTKTPLRRNQYGFTLGGPIYIPHLFNGRDKAFWFFNYEGLKVRVAETAQGVVPTAAQLEGNLTDQPKFDDPTLTVAGPGGALVGTQMSCNGTPNVICPTRFDSWTKAYTGVWYAPGVSSLPTTNSPYNSVVTSPSAQNQYQVNSRIDYKLKDNLNFYARYTDQDSSTINPYALTDNYNNLTNHYQNAVASFTWLVSPTTVVDFKSAVNRTLIFTADNDRGWTAFSAANPIQGTPIQNAAHPLFPEVYISGMTAPSQTGNPFLTTNLQELASVSMIRGKHSIKFGYELTHMHGWTDGLFTSQFNYQAPQTADPANIASTGSPLASYLLGIPEGGTRNVGVTAAYEAGTNHALYVQDDIKIKSNLTVNLGVRYEYDQWPVEVHNHLSEFDFTQNKFVWAGYNPLIGQPTNISDRALMSPNYHNFAPRVGLSYGLGNKTTVRAGYGIFYSSNYFWEGQGARGTWPYALGDTIEGINAPSLNAITYDETMYPNYNAPVPGTPADAQHTMGRHNKTPYSEQWNIGVQRELANNLMLEVEYVGDGGRHMSLFTNRNDPLPGPGAVGDPGHFRPFQYTDPLAGTYAGGSIGFGADSDMENSVSSSYNSLQVKLDKKFSDGLQALVSYTYGHYIDIGGSGFSQSSAPQIDTNPAADRGDGTFDYRHILSASWVYELPAGKGRRFLSNGNPVVTGVLGGWEFTGIFHANTGGPLGIGLNQDIANIGQRGMTARPDYVGGVQRTSPASGGDQTLGYINAAAFAIQPLYTYGDLGRNTARNLGAQSFTLGLYKNFPIRENKESIQFRAEFFNAFNHVNLGGIDGTLEDKQFGTIGGTANDSREIQLALKLYF